MSITGRALLVLPILLAGCDSGQSPATHIVVTGSRDVAPLVNDIARRFEQRHKYSPRQVRVNVETTSSEQGATACRNGLAEIGMIARPLHPDEAGLHVFPIATDGLALLVHRDNPVGALDLGQVVGLFRGVFSNWREVGGEDRLVKVVSVAQGRSLREVFADYYGMSSLRVEMPASSTDQVIAAVASQPGAIGYACLGRAEHLASKHPIRTLPQGTVPATLEELRAGRYPFIRSLSLLTRDQPTGLVAEFIEFARSEKVRDLLETHGLAAP